MKIVLIFLFIFFGTIFVSLAAENFKKEEYGPFALAFMISITIIAYMVKLIF